MISTKILAQAGAAGLMTAAVLASPLFLPTTAYSPSPCRFEATGPTERVRPPAHRVRHVQPTVRRVERRADPRDIAERNRAARDSLNQLGEVYEHEKVSSDYVLRIRHQDGTTQRIDLRALVQETQQLDRMVERLHVERQLRQRNR